MACSICGLETARQSGKTAHMEKHLREMSDPSDIKTSSTTGVEERPKAAAERQHND